MDINKLYKEVTATVIKQLEDGVPPWVRPWKDGKRRGVGMIPSNLISGRLYSGGNILLLWMAAQQHGWDSLQFCPYLAANKVGGTVRRGEKGIQILFTSHHRKKDEATGEERPYTFVKTHTVFHASQLENIPEKYLQPQQREEGVSVPKNERAVDFAQKTGITIRHEGNKAFYSPAQDIVVVPPFSSFKDEEGYHGTVCHELVHATGHEKRLNRQFGKRFGDERYAAEELVAELGSAYLCARLGYKPGFRSASYLASWLKVLKSDNRAIFTAASYAGQASSSLWDKAFPESVEESSEVEKTAA